MTTPNNITSPQFGLTQFEVNHSADVSLSINSSFVSVPLPLSSGRSGLQPQLSLSYSSSPVNSVFGLDWSFIGLSYIRIDLKDGNPQYDQTDNYAFNGSITLLPVLKKRGSNWKYRTDSVGDYTIYYFRAKYETTFEAQYDKFGNSIQ